jgi:tetratricopeptide (TPR) repeat protein
MPDDLLTSFRTRLAQGADPALLADLEATVVARREQRGGHADWGLLCEDAGLFAVAFREFQLALRDVPDDPVAGFRLAHHYRERGDTGRAAGLLERLLQKDPARDDCLAALADILREEDARPRLQAALQRAVQAGLPPARARFLAQGEGEGEGDAAAAAEQADEELSPPTPTASDSSTSSPAARTSTPASGPTRPAKAATARSRNR